MPDSTKQNNPPLPAPSKRYDVNWAEKIEKAKQARIAGKIAREGKPVVFPTRQFIRP